MNTKFLLRCILAIILIAAATYGSYFVMAKKSAPVVPITVSPTPESSNQTQISSSPPPSPAPGTPVSISPPAEDNNVAAPPPPALLDVQFNKEFKLGQGQTASINDTAITLNSVSASGSVDIIFKCKNIQPLYITLSAGEGASGKPDCIVGLTFVRMEKNQAVFLVYGVR